MIYINDCTKKYSFIDYVHFVDEFSLFEIAAVVPVSIIFFGFEATIAANDVGEFTGAACGIVGTDLILFACKLFDCRIGCLASLLGLFDPLLLLDDCVL